MTATKLTKTERTLLERAAKNHRGLVSAERCLVTSQKYGSHGSRATSALCNLRDKGLVGPIRSIKSVEYRSGWSTHYTELTAEITEAGREAIR